MTRRALLRAGVFAAGLGVLFLLARRVDWRASLALLAGVRLPWLAAAFAVGAFLRVFRGSLWRFYLGAAGYRADRGTSLVVLLAGDFLGTFFVGSLGSFARPLLLRLVDERAPLESGTESVILEQYLTLASHALVLFIGGGLLLARPGMTAAVLMPAFVTGLLYTTALLAASAVIFDWHARGAATQRLGGLLSGPVHRRLAGLADLLRRFRGRLACRLGSRAVLLPGFGAQVALNTVLVGAHSFCLLQSLGIAFPYPLLLVVPTMFLTLANVPVSPGGVGIVEGYGLLLLTRLGLPGASALSYLLLERSVSTLATLALGGLAIGILGLRRAVAIASVGLGR